MPSLTVQVYAQTLVFLLSIFSLFVMTLIVRNCNRGDLLLVNPLILHISLGRSMGYPFPPNTQAVSSFFPLSSLFAKFLFLFQSLTLLSSNCSLLSKSMRSWYGWLRISSWRWPTTRGSYMVLEEWPTQAVVVMMMVVVARRRIRRRHHWSPVVTAYIQQTIHNFWKKPMFPYFD